MLNRPFLTDVDPRGAVKGSRDPLGIQAIWTSFGRHVVGNLTTVTSSVRDFTATLLGYWLIHRARTDGADVEPVPLFLKWEQLAAFVRVDINGEAGVRGTERVNRRLNDSRTVTISADGAYQILSNQRTYGLWGLYSVASEKSGWVTTEPAGVTEEAMRFVEGHYLALLAKEGMARPERLLQMLAPRLFKFDLKSAQKTQAAALAKLFSDRLRAPERKFYREHLVYGGPKDSTGGLQRILADLLVDEVPATETPYDPRVMKRLSQLARKKMKSDTLAFRLERIQAAESLLAPCSDIFGFLLARDGARLDAVVDIMRDSLGASMSTVVPAQVVELKEEIARASDDDGGAARWMSAAEAMSAGDYGTLIRTLLEHHAHLMKTRAKAGPWIEIDNGKLKVSNPDELTDLPTSASLKSLWQFPYFLGSLHRVAHAVREDVHG